MTRPTFSEAIKDATQVKENVYVKAVPNGYRIITSGYGQGYSSELVTKSQLEAIYLFLSRLDDSK